MSNVVTGFFWHSTENYTWSFWVMFCAGQNYLNLKEPKEYWLSRFFFIWSELSKNYSLRRLFFFATPSPHYHDLGQIFPMLAQGWVLYVPRYANISNVGPRLVFGRTSLRPVRSATTTGQYSPLRSYCIECGNSRSRKKNWKEQWLNKKDQECWKMEKMKRIAKD